MPLLKICVTLLRHPNKKILATPLRVCVCACVCECVWCCAALAMGARRGGGALAPPLEFEKSDVICCRPTKYPKIFARAGRSP